MITDKIVFILPIFVPNQIGYDIQMESIRSFFTYVSFNGYKQLKVVLTGWCKDEFFWDGILTYCYSRDHSIEVIKHDKNYGKAVVVNKAFTEYAKPYKYMMTWDSDIKFDIDEKDVIKRCFDVAEQIDNFGLLSLNQKEQNCHLFDTQTEFKRVGYEILSYSKDGSGIAGGCLFISVEKFSKVNGYKVLGIYDADDGNLMLDFAKSGYFIAVTQGINIIHPKTIELFDGYNKWKQLTLQSRRDGKIKSYKESMENTESVWMNK